LLSTFAFNFSTCRYGTDVKANYLRTGTDVTSVSLDGTPWKRLPSEMLREPPLNIFHGRGQGLPLVLFSAQPEPFESLNSTNTPYVSHKLCSSQSEQWTSESPWLWDGAACAAAHSRATA
jgi:hypothetical protein